MAEDRINIQRKFPKLNSNLDKLVAKLDWKNSSKKKRHQKEEFKEQILTDEWFKGLFTKDYEIDN